MEENNKDPFSLDTGGIAHLHLLGSRPILEKLNNFSFVLNISQLVTGDAIPMLPIAADHVLRKANDSEIEAIKDVLENFGHKSWASWESVRVSTGEKSAKFEKLPKDQWKYYVIEFKGSNFTMAEVEQIMCLLPFELKIGFTLLANALPKIIKVPTTAVIYHPGKLFAQLQRLNGEVLPFVEMSSEKGEEIKSLHAQFVKCDKKLLNPEQFTKQVRDLDALPYYSPMVFMGLFAILESLLTHAPKKTDTIDSITRQVKQKIILLDNRWESHLDYSPFKVTKPSNIWSAMYSYRSSLAHGSVPNFKSDLAVLGSHEQALSLLKQTVSRVLRQAVIEPRLMVDLRNC